MATQLIKWLDTDGAEHDTKEQAEAADARLLFASQLCNGTDVVDEDARNVYDWLMKNEQGWRLLPPGPAMVAPMPPEPVQLMVWHQDDWLKMNANTKRVHPEKVLQSTFANAGHVWTSLGEMSPAFRHPYGTLPPGCVEFKEPGTGLWMKLNMLYVISDDGAFFTYKDTDIAIAFTRQETEYETVVGYLRGPAFQLKHELTADQIGYTLSVEAPCPLACNVVSGQQMLHFWQKTDPTQLEYR